MQTVESNILTKDRYVIPLDMRNGLPFINVKRRSKPIATDIVYSDVVAIDYLRARQNFVGVRTNQKQMKLLRLLVSLNLLAKNDLKIINESIGKVLFTHASTTLTRHPIIECLTKMILVTEAMQVQ